MSEENKEVRDDEWGTSWDSTIWVIVLFMIIFGFGFPRDTQDHELRERVARLEGQMDMIRR